MRTLSFHWLPVIIACCLLFTVAAAQAQTTTALVPGVDCVKEPPCSASGTAQESFVLNLLHTTTPPGYPDNITQGGFAAFLENIADQTNSQFNLQSGSGAVAYPDGPYIGILEYYFAVPDTVPFDLGAYDPSVWFSVQRCEVGAVDKGLPICPPDPSSGPAAKPDIAMCPDTGATGGAGDSGDPGAPGPCGHQDTSRRDFILSRLNSTTTPDLDDICNKYNSAFPGPPDKECQPYPDGPYIGIVEYYFALTQEVQASSSGPPYPLDAWEAILRVCDSSKPWPWAW